MSSNVSLELQLGELVKDLEAMAARAPAIMSRALNRAGTAGRTAMTRTIVKDTGLQSKYVSREIVLEKANRTRPVVRITVAGRRIPLIAFRARGPEPSRGRGRGVSYHLPGGRGRVPDAFITTVGAGHRGVFKRRREKRLPIVELKGPSIPHVFEKQMPVFQAAAQESLVKNVASEIAWERAKQAQADSGQD